MLQRTIASLCIALSFLAGAQENSAAPDPKHALAGKALAQALRGGGNTVYFRHTATDFSRRDLPTFEAAVLRPAPSSGWTVVARLRVDDWARLRADLD
jgi:hypothetical protein